MQEKGWLVFRERKINLNKDTKIEPDFILYDGQNLLIIEFKFSLIPAEPAQVISKMKNIENGKQGIEQVRKYINLFESNIEDVLAQLSIDKINGIYGMLLFRWPMPVPFKRTPDVTKLDWPSLERYLSSVENLSVVTLLEWFNNRTDILPEGSSFSTIPYEVVVDDWTYKCSIAAIVTDELS